MIITRLMGGLGNQMFQYAAGRRLALARGTELLLDLSHFEDPPAGDVARRFELDCFRIVARRTTERVAGVPGWRSLLARGRPRLVRERSRRFQPEVLDAPDDSLLVGFWQSEKYFEDAAARLREELVLASPLSPEKRAVAAEIDENHVSIHVRRGDYASHPASSRFLGTLPLDYYARAIELIRERLPDPRFVVVSDDPEWCREHLAVDGQALVLERTPGRDYEDLHLMALCRHHVIANSSFGWWAAWLGTAADKTVVAPRRWFADPSQDARDLVPEDWVRL